MADLEYRFVTTQAGQFATKVGELAADGFSVNNFVKDGNHFYVLLEKWTYPEDEDTSYETEAEELWSTVLELKRQFKVLTELLVPGVEEEEAPAEE